MRVEVNVYFDDGVPLSHDTILDLLSPYDAVYHTGGFVLEGGFYRMLGWKWEPKITNVKTEEKGKKESDG